MPFRPLATLTAAGAMTAFGATLSAQELRVIVAEYSSATGPYFEEVAAGFEEQNPDADIQIEVVPWDVLLQRLTTDISGGSTPDLSIIGTRWLIDFVSEGIAAPPRRIHGRGFSQPVHRRLPRAVGA